MVLNSIMTAIGNLVNAVPGWVTQFTHLFFIYAPSPTGRAPVGNITGLSFVGIFCLVVPLVGLGIGIIRRLVKVRA